MYKKTPNRTDIGTNRRRGDISTESPTETETMRALTLCSEKGKKKKNYCIF